MPLTSEKEPKAPYSNPATVVLICGSPGRGKTTAVAPPNTKGLPPEETLIIQPSPKILPFPGARKYKTQTCDWRDTLLTMRHLPAGVRYLVVDDFDYLLAGEFMTRIKEAGWDKWNDIASHGWSIIHTAAKLDSGIFVFILAHEDVYDGNRVMKTFGRLLREKLEPEGLCAIVLWAEVEVLDTKKGISEYFFRTQSDGVTNAKSPAGMFPYEIPNDLHAIARRIDEYYDGVTLDQSKVYPKD